MPPTSVPPRPTPLPPPPALPAVPTKKPRQTPLTGHNVFATPPRPSRGERPPHAPNGPTQAARFISSSNAASNSENGRGSVSVERSIEVTREEGRSSAAPSSVDSRLPGQKTTCISPVSDSTASNSTRVVWAGHVGPSRPLRAGLPRFDNLGDKPLETPRKLTSLSAMTTPWTMRSDAPARSPMPRGAVGVPLTIMATRFGLPSTPTTKDDVDSGSESSNSRKRKLGELEVSLPRRPVGESEDDTSRRVSLGNGLDGVKLEEVEMGQAEREKEAKREREKAEMELGWGISPRKGKVKYTGRGEKPLSLRLASLLATQSSSLTLFYTSLQHTLARSAHTGQSANTAKNPLQTAPIRLVLVRPLSSRQQAAQVWIARVKKWPEARQNGPQPGDDTRSSEEICVSLLPPKPGSGKRGSTASVLGLDIRLIAAKWRERESGAADVFRHEQSRASDGNQEPKPGWEVGVWSEWTVVDVPEDQSWESEARNAEGKGTMDAPSPRSTKMLFASRYLITEIKPSQQD